MGASSAYVRIQPSRLEWSVVGREWVIQMAPLSSLTAVTAEIGLNSKLCVTTTVGNFEFSVQPETAEQARSLLTQLIAKVADEPLVVGQDNTVAELINLQWVFDDQPMSMLGS